MIIEKDRVVLDEGDEFYTDTPMVREGVVGPLLASFLIGLALLILGVGIGYRSAINSDDRCVVLERM